MIVYSQMRREGLVSKQAPVLVPIAHVTKCMLCNLDFTFLRRKQQCRGCGAVSFQRQRHFICCDVRALAASILYSIVKNY